MVKPFTLLLFVLFPLLLMAKDQTRHSIADSKDINPMLHKADSLWQHFQIEESLDLYQNLAKQAHEKGHYKDELECFLRMADIMYETDQLDEAKIILFKAKELDAYFLQGAHHAYITYYKGKIFFKSDELEEAIRYWQASISAQGIRVNDSLLLSSCYAEMSFAHNLLGDHELAKIFNDLSKELHVSVINFRNEAQLQMKKRNYKRAIHYLNAALMFTNHFSEAARLKSDLAWAQYKNKHYATALESYDDALKIFERFSPINTAASYSNIGIIRLNQEEDVDARAYFQKAQKIHLNYFGEDHISIAKDYTAIGKTYQQSNMPDSAMWCFKEAATFYSKRPGSYSRYVCRNNLYMAQLLSQTKDFAKAIFHIDQAGFSLDNAPNKYLELQVKELKSWVYLQQYLEEEKTGALVKAAEVIKDAVDLVDEVLYRSTDVAERLAMLEEFESVYTNGIAINRILHAQSYSQDNAAEVAFTYMEKNKANVLKAMMWETEIKRFAGMPNEVLRKEKQLKKEKAKFEILNEKALKQSKYNYQDSLIQNAETFDLFIAKLEEDYPRYYELKYAPPSLNFSQLQEGLDEETAILSYYLEDSIYNIFSITNDKVDWQTHHKYKRGDEEFVEEVEYEEVRGPYPSSGGGHGPNQYPNEDSEVDPPKKKKKLFDLGKIFNTGDNDGEMPDVELPPNPTKIKDKKVKEKKADKPDIQYFAQDFTTRGLDFNINYFLRAIRKFDKDLLMSSGYSLYEKLIDPVLDNIKDKDQLIIIPHDELYYLPFDALMTRKIAGYNRYSKLPYLIYDYTISYQHSASLFYELNNRIHNEYDLDFTGFAPVFSDSVDAGYVWESTSLDSTYHADASNFRDITVEGKWFQELKYSETEVLDIAKLFEENQEAAKIYLHQEASESNFKNRKLNSRFVHVASHSFVDKSDLANNGLVFANAPNRKEDNILYASETFNLDIKADLLVLSSCESGLGTLAKGEGVLALYRGFLYAGCQNVMVSLWKVYDEHTGILMKDFYEQSLSGKPYAQALRQAKLNMLLNERTAAPKKWSGFVLIGQ